MARADYGADRVKRRSQLALAVIFSVALVALVPGLVVAGFFVDHAASYSGTCGPYPTDIPAHPCSFETYVENFFGGFSGAGLVMIAIVTGAGTAFLLAFVWVLGVVVYYVVRRPPTQRPER